MHFCHGFLCGKMCRYRCLLGLFFIIQTSVSIRNIPKTANGIDKTPNRRFYFYNPELLPHVATQLGMLIPQHLYKPLESFQYPQYGAEDEAEEYIEEHEEKRPTNVQLLAFLKPKMKQKQRKKHKPKRTKKPHMKQLKKFKKCLPFKLRIIKKADVEPFDPDDVPYGYKDEYFPQLVSINTTSSVSGRNATRFPGILHLMVYPKHQRSKTYKGEEPLRRNPRPGKNKPWRRNNPWRVAPSGRPITKFQLKEPTPDAHGGSPPSSPLFNVYKDTRIPISLVYVGDRQKIGPQNASGSEKTAPKENIDNNVEGGGQKYLTKYPARLGTFQEPSAFHKHQYGSADFYPYDWGNSSKPGDSPEQLETSHLKLMGGTRVKSPSNTHDIKDPSKDYPYGSNFQNGFNLGAHYSLGALKTAETAPLISHEEPYSVPDYYRHGTYNQKISQLNYEPSLGKVATVTPTTAWVPIPSFHPHGFGEKPTNNNYSAPLKHSTFSSGAKIFKNCNSTNNNCLGAKGKNKTRKGDFHHHNPHIIKGVKVETTTSSVTLQKRKHEHFFIEEVVPESKKGRSFVSEIKGNTETEIVTAKYPHDGFNEIYYFAPINSSLVNSARRAGLERFGAVVSRSMLVKDD